MYDYHIKVYIIFKFNIYIDRKKHRYWNINNLDYLCKYYINDYIME